MAARDPFMCLVPAAQVTRKIRLGVVVVSPHEMHPMKIGNALLTLNEFCQGRAEVVVGGGGYWCSRMGTEAQRMVRAIREAIEIIISYSRAANFACQSTVGGSLTVNTAVSATNNEFLENITLPLRQ